MCRFVVTILAVTAWICLAAAKFKEEHACFISILDISCAENEQIVLESARYGRNDSSIAERCQTRYAKNCDIDVTLPLNRNCAGKRSCQLHVNTALFGDPCGYEEFLIVRYECVQNSMVSSHCPIQEGPPLYDHGYLASPNYPGNYYRDAQCQWTLSVQKHQTISVTIYDFDLDVKHGGKCTDYLEIASGDRVYFKDCGTLGRQKIEIDAQHAEIRFNTALSSLTNRGFFVYFEGIGPGCKDFDDILLGSAEYYMEDDILYANATCEYGHVFAGTIDDFIQVKCLGSQWSQNLRTCVPFVDLTTPGILPPITVIGQTGPDPTSATIGVVLGIISALLLLSLLLIMILYYKKSRRRRYQKKRDEWRVVVNNLQDNELNEYCDDDHTLKHHCSDSDDLSPTCNLAKAKRNYKQNNYHGAAACKELMDSVDYTMDYSDMNTTGAKYIYDVPPQPKAAMSRKGSRASVTKSMHKQKSRDRILEDPNKTICSECGHNTPKTKKRRPQSQRDLRSKRKSGQFAHHHHNRSAAQTPIDPDVPIYGFPRQITQSAPDLMQLECAASEWTISPDEPYGFTVPSQPPSVHSTPYHNTSVVPSEEVRRATIGTPGKAKQKLNYVNADPYEDIKC